MNDLFFIRYQPKLMLVDSMDMPNDVELAHRRLCDFVWAMDRSPQDDDIVLPSICRVRPGEWVRVKGGLQLKGWHSHEGFFEHNGALKTLKEAKDDYLSRQERTKAATEARLARIAERDDKRDEKRDDARDVNRGEMQLQSQSQSQSQSTSSLNISLESKNPPKGQSSNFRALKIANRIISNQDSWHWENCKVPIGGLKSRSLATVIEPHLDNTRLIAEWQSAVREAHGAVVDGLPKAKRNPVGYCIACFKARVSV